MLILEIKTITYVPYDSNKFHVLNFVLVPLYAQYFSVIVYHEQT